MAESIVLGVSKETHEILRVMAFKENISMRQACANAVKGFYAEALK